MTESAILKSILRFAKIHPVVRWCERMNTGMMKKGPHYVRFGFKGLSDVIGQVRGGGFLAIEVKDATGKVSAEQKEFLDMVNKSGGIGLVARSLEDVRLVLDGLLERAA